MKRKKNIVCCLREGIEKTERKRQEENMIWKGHERKREKREEKTKTRIE